MSIDNLSASLPAVETSLSIETTQSEPVNILPAKPADSDFFEYRSEFESEQVQILQALFSLRDGIIVNEKWENSYILSGRINAVSEEFVACETIIDKASKKTELRHYPRIQFAHLPVLKAGSTVKIKINEKPGSFRIDIIDGSNMGIEKEFENLVLWDQLADFEMDDPDEINDESNF